jgi:hypothetical protein
MTASSSTIADDHLLLKYRRLHGESAVSCLPNFYYEKLENLAILLASRQTISKVILPEIYPA